MLLLVSGYTSNSAGDSCLVCFIDESHGWMITGCRITEMVMILLPSETVFIVETALSISSVLKTILKNVNLC